MPILEKNLALALIFWKNWHIGVAIMTYSVTPTYSLKKNLTRKYKKIKIAVIK